MIRLPRTSACLVCGRDNPHGLQVRLEVEPASGLVRTRVVAGPHHAGFIDIVHGGLIATVVDEAMVWAATWKGGRFCVCGEMTNRFRRPANPGRPFVVEAIVTSARSRLIETSARVFDEATGDELSTATGKYVPMSADQHAQVCATFLDDEDSREAAVKLRGA